MGELEAGLSQRRPRSHGGVTASLERLLGAPAWSPRACSRSPRSRASSTTLTSPPSDPRPRWRGIEQPDGLVEPLAGIADPLPAVEEALAAELLSLAPTRLPREVEFPQLLMRAAVYDDLSAQAACAPHRLRQQLSAEPLSLADHVAASDGGDDELAAELRRTAEAEIAASG